MVVKMETKPLKNNRPWIRVSPRRRRPCKPWLFWRNKGATLLFFSSLIIPAPYTEVSFLPYMGGRIGSKILNVQSETLFAHCGMPGVQTFLKFGITDGEIAYIKDLIFYIFQVKEDE